jgi:hypothetical protein
MNTCFEIDDLCSAIVSYLKTRDALQLSFVSERFRRNPILSSVPYSFSQKYSLRYGTNGKFHSRVNRKIKRERLHLTLPGYKFTVVRLTRLGNAHSLQFLDDRYSINDVSMLGSVHTLDISGCIFITDVSMLGGVHTLDISGCIFIRDVSMLVGVHALNISGCENIRKVSMLGGVHTLYMSNCQNIRDVSMRWIYPVAKTSGTCPCSAAYTL